jgi:tRNA A-37 threonylcarbamoyl transferase component Bud32
MSQDSRLLDLIIEWEELRSEGRTARPEELCQDCPELLEELRKCLGAMAGLDAMLDVPAPPPATLPLADPKVDPTSPFAELPRTPDGTGRAHWPHCPGYEILAEIGQGGMGVVFKARQIALNRIVALKTVRTQGAIRTEQQRRFVQEAQAMALLQHPNIVQVHEIGESEGHPFLVMEYVPGVSLREKLAGKPLPPRQAAEMVAVLAQAVQAAHAQGIIHRDLKPNNILLAADGTVKICDFGVAKCLEGSADFTQTGQLLGTPSYMAPEQINRTRGTQGPAVDIYALGVLLYELLTGRPPFLADNPLDTLQLVTSQEPVPPRRSQPRTPADLETICLKCLAKVPSRRYASAQLLAEDLQRFLSGAPICARPLGVLERGWRWGRTHPAGTALISVVALALVVVVSIVLVYDHRVGQELQRTDAAHRQVLITQQKLHHTLTEQVAERLDGDLRELAAVPLTMATLLEDRGDWEEQRLDHVLKDLLDKTPLIFGLCVAFEPQQWQKDREDFAYYVFRRPDGLAAKQLVPPAYRPNYRQWQWYRAGKDSPHGCWSEPYIGAGGDNTPMVTFSAPIRRQGQFVGVVTADLAMDYFRDLRRRVDRLDLGPQSHCFLVSAGRQILTHPVDRYEFPGLQSELMKLPLDPSFLALVDQWTRYPAGVAQAVDFFTGQPASFLFSRVPSAGWTLVTVIY